MKVCMEVFKTGGIYSRGMGFMVVLNSSLYVRTEPEILTMRGAARCP
jgi:hypothetical protein